MQAVLQFKAGAAGQTATEIMGMERSGGEEVTKGQATKGLWK